MTDIVVVVQRLEAFGYRLAAEGENIRVRRAVRVSAPEEEIRRLLGLLKARKAEALAYLRARDGPHPSDCVCADCLMKPFFRSAPAEGADEPTGEAEGPAVKEFVVMGRQVRAYPARRECLERVDPATGERGACLWLTFPDCNLYPLIGSDGRMTGWCRERPAGAASGEERARWVLAQLDKTRLLSLR